MAAKTDFSPDEWKLLLQSPLIVGIAVSAAEPSGLFGVLKESMASARALVQAKLDPNADALVKAVAADYETSERRTLAQDGIAKSLGGDKQADIVAKALAALKSVSALLDSKAPSDAGPSRRGSPASPTRLRKRRPRVDSSVLAGFRSATPRRRRSSRSQARSALQRPWSEAGRGASSSDFDR